MGCGARAMWVHTCVTVHVKILGGQKLGQVHTGGLMAAPFKASPPFKSQLQEPPSFTFSFIAGLLNLQPKAGSRNRGIHRKR